ncbi:UNVERIFIED_CONTAM: hypothetical protein FKN15_065815 [Acipenser sinensis]
MAELKKDSGQMSNTQLIQQLAMLNWLKSDSVESKEILAAVTGVQVAQELLQRLTGQDKVDAYKRECIHAIAAYVKNNPRASQGEINKEVEKQVLQFAARVQALESTPLF